MIQDYHWYMMETNIKIKIILILIKKLINNNFIIKASTAKKNISNYFAIDLTSAFIVLGFSFLYILYQLSKLLV